MSNNEVENNSFKTSIFNIQYSIFIINNYMKKALLSVLIIFQTAYCMAQEQLSFPFQGGKDVMTGFFKNNLTVSPEIVQKRATGTAIFKFTANEKGGITKIIVYYADDDVLVPPIVEALKKSDHKWIIPDNEKTHDFVISFNVSFNPPVTMVKGLPNAVYNGYIARHPIIATDQVPLNEATLLPVVKVGYDVGE